MCILFTFPNGQSSHLIENWPASSPDYNMIEYVWSVLHKDLANKGNPKNAAQLKEWAIEVWDAIPQAKIDKICRHLLTIVKESDE